MMCPDGGASTTEISIQKSPQDFSRGLPEIPGGSGYLVAVVAANHNTTVFCTTFGCAVAGDRFGFTEGFAGEAVSQ